MTQKRLRLGETLVEAGVLTQEVLEKALQLQKKRQLRLGTILLQEGFCTESQLVQALSLKLSIPWVSLWRVDISEDLLDLVPANVAEEFFLMPIYIRTTKGGERALYVAMNDPTDEDALKFVSATAGIPVKPMIAGPTDIASAIRSYYYDEDDEDEMPLPSAAAQLAGMPVAPGATSPGPPPPPGAAAPPPPPPKQASDGGPGAPPPPPKEVEPQDIEELDEDSLKEELVEEEEAENEEPGAPDVAAEEEEKTEEDAEETGEEVDDGGEAAPEESEGGYEEKKPAEGAGDKVYATKEEAQREAEKRLFGVGNKNASGGFSLTLLDGTTVSLGRPIKKKSAAVAAVEGRLTREDLLKGLAAAAQGTPLDGFLPSDRWEPYLAALLKILLNKHLVFYEEFMKELESMTKKG